jgi:hypothetical protein
MSYTYLQERGEESLAASFSDIPASVLSKLNLTAKKSCCDGNATESCPSSPSGTMSEPLTEDHGAGKLTLCAEDSLARTLASGVTGRESAGREVGYGQSRRESFAKYDRDTHSLKTRQLLLAGGLESFSETWPKWGTMQNGECWARGISEHGICVKESGWWLPTPGKNEFYGSATKRFVGSPEFRGTKMSEGLRTCKEDPTYLTPCFGEYVMGWPIMWTALAPLATDKFRQWLDSHGKH